MYIRLFQLTWSNPKTGNWNKCIIETSRRREDLTRITELPVRNTVLAIELSDELDVVIQNGLRKEKKRRTRYIGVPLSEKTSILRFVRLRINKIYRYSVIKRQVNIGNLLSEPLKRKADK